LRAESCVCTYSFKPTTTLNITTTQKQQRQRQGDLFKKLIRSGGSLDERYVAAEVVLPLLTTLAHLHARRIYHRDIK
jgi:serine/threonine protein kinase